jgi:hypothetical protein
MVTTLPPLRVMTSVRCPRSAHMASMSASVVSDTRSPSVRRGTQRRPKPAVQVRKNSSGGAAGASLREPERFASIFERHFAAIHHYLARRLGEDLADDLAAQVFLVAFERRR